MSCVRYGAFNKQKEKRLTRSLPSLRHQNCQPPIPFAKDSVAASSGSSQADSVFGPLEVFYGCDNFSAWIQNRPGPHASTPAKSPELPATSQRNAPQPD